ncbi:MAG: hypothetical protein ABFR02_03755 [Campylobacterota bacterium]
MRPLLGLLLLANLLYAEFEYKGYVGVDAQGYITKPDGKHPANFTLQQQLELAYSVGDFESAATIYTQEDSYDLSDEKNERSFVRLDEFYGRYNFDNDMIFAGRNIRFWGALEANNVVDTFNTKDFRTDGLDTQKQGAWNVAYTHYTESGEISLIVKLYEEKQPMAAYPYVYYFFPENTQVGKLEYDKDIQSVESLYRPTVYLNWSGSTESDYPVDYAFILQHGFDGQRAFASKTDPLTFTTTLNEEAYLVNKAMTYNTMVVGSTLLKLEAQATDVIDTTYTAASNVQLRVEDYYQFGLGLEHTLSGVIGDADLGLIGEYYYYNTFKQESGIADDLTLFQIFQNDLFVGLRYTFNDASDSSIIAGAIVDLEYEEQSYSIEYQTRFFDVLSMKADYAYINPSTTEPTAYALMGSDPNDPTATPTAHQRVGINLAYHF